MTALDFRIEADCASDGTPQVGLFIGVAEAMFAFTLTAEEAYAQADAMVRAADEANQRAAEPRGVRT